MVNQPNPTFVAVNIEIPRGSFVKRGSRGQIDYLSPVPCPFNYGSVLAYQGLDGDYLDAVVLGKRLATGTQLQVQAWAAIALVDAGQYDDKLICSIQPLTPWQKQYVLLFFEIYAKAKMLINFVRGHKGRNACEGWLSAAEALQRAKPQ